jgi:hypothetical protein
VQTGVQMATEACGFITIVGGTFLLHTTRDLDLTPLDLDRLTKSDRASGDAGAAAAAAARAGSGSAAAATLRGRRPALQTLEMAGSGGKHLSVDLGSGGGDVGGASMSGDREDDALLGSSRKR